MSDVLQAIFNPAQQTKGIMGKLGSSGGSQGGRFGHLGEEFGHLSQTTFDTGDHFDVNKQFDPTNHFDPTKLLKRY
jgi:hypothetical protein